MLLDGVTLNNVKVLAVFVLALALRVIYFLEIRGSAVFQNPILDSWLYFTWAQEISGGVRIGPTVFPLNPGYAYFLAGIFKLFTIGLTAPVVIQSLLGACSCVVIYALGKRLFDGKTALLAASLASVYPVSIFYDGLLVTAGIIHFLNGLALYLLLTSTRRWHLFFPGAVLGLSALFRPTVLAFVPLALLWLALRHKKYSPIFFVAGCAIVLSPVFLRNYAVGKQLTIASAGFGMNFFIGNNPQAVGTYVPQTFESADPRFQAEDYRQEASRITGRILTGAEASTFWFSMALNYIIENPRHYAALLFKKAALFINKAEIPTNMDIAFLSGATFLRSVSFLSFGVIFPCALLGMLTAGGLEVRLLTFYVISYFAANLLFFAGSEYRYPVMPALFLFCAHGVRKLLPVRSFREAARPAAILGVFFLLSNLDLYRSAPSVSHTNLGNIYLRQGHSDAAMVEYRKALAGDPDNVTARSNIAALYFNTRRYPMAIAEYQRILEINPAHAEAHYYLGLSFHDLGDQPRALAHLKRAMELKPDWKEARAFHDLVRGTAR